MLFKKTRNILRLPKNSQFRTGFTLIEMMIAISLFTVAVSIAIGGFISILRSQRQISSLMSANSNTSLVIEQMAREFRTGFDFCANSTKSNTACDSLNSLAFINSEGQTVVYSLSNGAIHRSVNGGPDQQITSNNVIVQDMRFILLGNEKNDNYPPRITIILGISPKEGDLQGDITHIQTTISARQIDS